MLSLTEIVRTIRTTHQVIDCLCSSTLTSSGQLNRTITPVLVLVTGSDITEELTESCTLTGAFSFYVLYVYNVFKSTLAALATVAGLTGFIAPAQAAPQTCAIRTPDREIIETTCDVHTRVNANGHKVNDITMFSNGRTFKMSVILWKNANGTPDYAEAFYQGKQEALPYFRAQNGMFGVNATNGFTFYF